MFAKESRSGKGGLIFTLLLAIVIFFTCYFSCAGGANFKTDAPDMDTIDGLLSTSLPLPNDGSRPDDHAPNDNAYYAFTSMAQADSFVSYTTGEAVTKVAFASVSQAIRAHRVVNNGEVYKESISHSSFKGVGMRTYVNNGNYIIWEADNVNSADDVSWKAEASKITKDSYISMFGCVPNAYTAYIMTDETIINSTYIGEENGIYSFRYDLNPETATTKIALEMRTMAGTKSLPLFEQVSLIVRMDENWRIREISTDCVYQVDMLGGVTCNETITEVFSDYDANTAVPNAEFLRSYMDAETTEPLPEELTPTDYLLNGFGEYLTGDKPLRVNISATGNEELPLSLDGKAEIHISLEDLSALSVRANINSVSFDELTLNDLFIGYAAETAYVKLGDLKACGTIEEITALINRLIPLFGNENANDEVAPLTESQPAEQSGALDFASLLANATLIRGETTTTVSLPLDLGGISINAAIIFNEGETVSLAGASVEVAGITVEITPDDTITVEEIGNDYHNITPIFDIIDENGNLPLDIAIGEDVNVLANIHLADTSVDINLDNLQAKLAQNTLFVKYGELQVKLAFDDVQPIIDKLLPILAGKVELPDLNALVQSLHIMDILSSAVSALETVEENGVLTISTTVEDVKLAIRLNITDAGYTLGGIDVNIGEFPITVSPATVPVPEIPAESLNEFYTIATLLDIIDENNEINLKATVDELAVDVNINLETLTILAKTEIFGETLFVKYFEEKVYISYKGLNVYADINDIDSVMTKLKPIIGEIDLSAFENINLEEIISGIIITDDENGLTISATLFGLNANILLDTTDNNLHIANISVVINKDKENELTVNVAPCEKASYDMPTATYYNIVTLLDIIDENGYISLSVDLDGATILATIDLNTLSLYATVEGVEIYADLSSGDVYLRYPGVLATMNFNDLEAIMEKLQPVIDKLAGDSALGDLDVSGFETLDVEKLISSIVVTETDGRLAISLEISGIDVTLNCLTADNNLTFENASVVLGDMQVTATQISEVFLPEFDLSETYVNAKELVDELGQALCDIFTSDELSATLSGTIVSGNSTITVSANVEIKGLETAPQAKALLTIKIVTNNDDGSVSETNHEVFLLYNDLSLVADGAPNVYFYYNDLTDVNDKFEGSFTTAKIDETLNILKKIYKNMPELQDALNFIFETDKDGYPVIRESSIDVMNLINGITLNDGLLAADLNGTALMSNLPEHLLLNLSAPNNVLNLSLSSLAVDTMSINGLTITLGKPATAFDGSTFTYTPSGTVHDFSSMNELLGALESTSRYRSFSITGKVSMKALSILDFTDKATITAQLEVINNKTYAVVNLARENVSMLGISIWNDYDGNTTLYFDPEEQMIYIKDESRTRKLTWTGYKYTTTYTYKKYTVDAFMANIKTILFDMLHFSSTIRKELDKPSTHTSYATIENTFLGYSYNGTNTFSVDLNLEPLLGDLQEVHLDIGHDSNMNITTLYAEMTAVSVLEVKLNASLTTHAEHAQRLDGVIASERSSGNY